jgi:hypothetical protein
MSPIPPGTEVLLKNEYKTSKLDPLFIGPLTVVPCTRGGSYTLHGLGGSILPRDIPPSKLKVLQDLSIPTDNQFEIDAIINHRNQSQGLEFLICWKGYNPSHDTWEPIANISDITAIQKYWSRNNNNKNKT